MEKDKFQSASTTICLQCKLNLNQKPKSNISSSSSISNFTGAGVVNVVKPAAPSLVNLCVGVIGKYLEDLIPHLSLLAPTFPAHIKSSMVAIARRRNLLNDHVLISLVDPSWEFLDVSSSHVSNSALVSVAQTCPSLRALDISQCRNVTAAGVYELVRHCHSVEVLRCGGCLKSDLTASRCLRIFKPKHYNSEAESWEELDTIETVDGAESLRWLVWPTIDKDSLKSYSKECPRVVVNPKPSPFGFRGIEVPKEAFPDTVLDDPLIKDFNPKTWAVSGFTPITTTPQSTSTVPIAEMFRLAFVERDTRLAAKRAKNARQQKRRAEKEEMMSNADVRAMALASRATRYPYT